MGNFSSKKLFFSLPQKSKLKLQKMNRLLKAPLIGGGRGERNRKNTLEVRMENVNSYISLNKSKLISHSFKENCWRNENLYFCTIGIDIIILLSE